MHFLSFWAKYCPFWHILSNARPKAMWTRCPGGFSVMWVTKLLIPLVKKNGFLAKKWPNLAQNWHCCPLLAHLVPWFLVWTSPIVGALGIKTLAEIRWLCIDHRSSRTMWYEVLKAPCILNPDWWPRSWLSNAGTSILEPYLHHLQRPNTVLDRLEQSKTSFSCTILIRNACACASVIIIPA